MLWNFNHKSCVGAFCILDGWSGLLASWLYGCNWWEKFWELGKIWDGGRFNFLYEGMKLSMTCRLENWKKNWKTARNESILLDFQLLLFGFKMEKLSLLSANCILSISTVWFFYSWKFIEILKMCEVNWRVLKIDRFIILCGLVWNTKEDR